MAPSEATSTKGHLPLPLATPARVIVDVYQKAMVNSPALHPEVPSTSSDSPSDQGRSVQNNLPDQSRTPTHSQSQLHPSTPKHFSLIPCFRFSSQANKSTPEIVYAKLPKSKDDRPDYSVLQSTPPEDLEALKLENRKLREELMKAKHLEKMFEMMLEQDNAQMVLQALHCTKHSRKLNEKVEKKSSGRKIKHGGQVLTRESYLEAVRRQDEELVAAAAKVAAAWAE
ncbi:hypothetical protein FRC03_004739 [Tulasnella sp. 419]|nr:hypothetical protein FRC03_004739 [Tulasnella sp. 419]